MFAHRNVAPSGGFWIRPALIGITEDELAACDRKELSLPCIQQIETAIFYAAQALWGAAPQGHA